MISIFISIPLSLSPTPIPRNLKGSKLLCICASSEASYLVDGSIGGSGISDFELDRNNIKKIITLRQISSMAEIRYVLAGGILGLSSFPNLLLVSLGFADDASTFSFIRFANSMGV